MTNCHDIDNLVLVEYLVNDSIIAYPDAPPILNATQFLALCWTGVMGKRLNCREYSVDNRPVKTFQLFTC